MSKGRFNFAPPKKKVSWTGLIQAGVAQNFLFNHIALNLFPLVKAPKKGFRYTCKI